MPAESISVEMHIEAPPERVFEYFTRPEAMLRWMGEWAALDPTPGGEFSVNIRGVPVRGSYLELNPPGRIVIAWGHAGSDRLPPGSSTVEVRLHADRGGTRVEVIHTGLPEPEATRHADGWRHFLKQLAKAATGDGRAPTSR